MRILLITDLFQPEPNHLKGLAFAQELVRKGHEVEVLTGFPNYPGGEIYTGYRQKFYQRETIGGIPIIRVPLFPDHSNSGLRRSFSYLSLALSACFPGLLIVRRPDVVHVSQGAATIALPAIALRLIRGVPYVLDVQDLWPESVASSGMFKIKWLQHPLKKCCDLIHSLAKRVVVLSPGYKKVLMERGVPEAKIEIVYNWSAEASHLELSSVKKESDPFGIDGYFPIIYAGNLGRVQALDAVIEAGVQLNAKYPDILLVFVGDGIDTERLKRIVSEKGAGNVLFVPRQPVSEIGAIYEKAQALLIHLRDDPLCRVGIPQKTQAYLASGRPIIIAVKGDASDLVLNAKAGISCEPENSISIADAIEKIYKMSSRERKMMGDNGKRYYEHHLTFALGSAQMESIFREALQ